MLDLFIVFVFIAAAVLGYRKGFLKSLIGLAGNVIALVSSYFLARPAALYLNQEYQAAEKIAAQIKNMIPMPADFTDVVASIDGMAKLYAYLEDSILPKAIQQNILDAVQQEVNAVGKGIFMTMADIIANSVAFSVLQGLTFIGLWIFLCLALGLSSRFFAGMIHQVPVLGTVDRIGGMAVCLFLVGLTMTILYSGIRVLGLLDGGIFAQSHLLPLFGNLLHGGPS